MRLAFGDFVFDSDTRELLCGGNRVTLSPKAFQLLEVLIENRPRALSKSVLLNRLWENTFVVEANLSNLVGEIRHALGEDSRAPQFVRTVRAEALTSKVPARNRLGSGTDRLGCSPLLDEPLSRDSPVRADGAVEPMAGSFVSFVPQVRKGCWR